MVFHPRVGIVRDEPVGAVVDDLAEVAQAVEVVVDFQVDPMSRAVGHRDRFVALRREILGRHDGAHCVQVKSTAMSTTGKGPFHDSISLGVNGGK